MEWIESGKLRGNEFLCIPVPKLEKVSFIKISDYVKGRLYEKKSGRVSSKVRNQYDCLKLKDNIVIDEDFAELAGYFISEGSTATRQFRIANNDYKMIERFSYLVKKKFDGIGKEKVYQLENYKGNKTYNIVFNSVIVASLFKKLFGCGAISKRIPDCLLFNSKYNIRKKLLLSLWAGDGCLEQRSARYTTISKILAYQVHKLLLSLGSFSFVSLRKESNKNNWYQIKVSGSSLRIFDKFKNYNSYEQTFFDKKYFYVPVKNISLCKYKDYVYNLEVEKTHSYVANGFVVHNCKYGKEEIIKADEFLDRPTGIGKRMKTIYHGVDLDVFKPVPEKLRKEFRAKFSEGKIKDETFLVVAIARNQRRKDLPRTMQVFSEFQKRRPDSFLYFHCQETDAWGSLREYARNWNLKIGEDWGVPAKFSANTGFPLEIVNLVYNAADCIISTSVGEGFGFYNIEGFATKAPVLAPNNTTHPELFNYDKDEDISDMDKLYKKVRGIPAKCHDTSSEWATYGAEDFERVRPLANVDDMVKKLIWIYDNPAKVKQIADRAYKWIQDYDWKLIAKKWDDLFQQTYDELEKERAKVKKIPAKKSKRQQVKLQI